MPEENVCRERLKAEIVVKALTKSVSTILAARAGAVGHGIAVSHD
jgi:hypothetical protein